MGYNFDERLDRTGNCSSKWEELESKFGRKDLIPLWVADMDIKVAPKIIEAMKEKLSEEIFGYVYRPETYYESAVNWIKKRFNYSISTNDLAHSPGGVPSICMLIEMLTEKEDCVLIQTPVYSSFISVVKNSGRKLLENELSRDEKGYYTIDFEDFEEKISKNNVKLFILCSPHNPIGRVWKKEELKKMGEICIKYNVRIISDELWRDLIMPGYVHIPTGAVSKEIEEITITLFSPTKTFNIAGLQVSFVVFPKKDEKEMFEDRWNKLDIKRNNSFSLVAVQAGYNSCEDWLEEIIKYIDGNMDYVTEYIKERLPMVKVNKSEGTYVLWIDFRNIGIELKEIHNFLINEARIAVSAGSDFGENGKGFARMNVACPRYMLEEAMDRLEKAIKNIDL